MEWDKEAWERLRDVPAPLRGFVTRKVEEVARRQGAARVTLDVWNAAKKLRGGSSAKDLPPPEVLSALVKETEARGQKEGRGFRLKLCGGAFGCPRPQIDVAELAGDLEAVLARSGHAERLTEALGEGILTHHKLALAVAGCVNACSEPQIKDFAVLGQARPEAVPGRCTGCRKCEAACKEGAVRAGGPQADYAAPEFDRTTCLNCGDCARACPAGAIALTPGYRVLVGGRLGRHPRLASELIPFTPDKEEVLEAFRKVLDWAAKVGQPGERLGALVDRCGLPARTERRP